MEAELRTKLKSWGLSDQTLSKFEENGINTMTHLRFSVLEDVESLLFNRGEVILYREHLRKFKEESQPQGQPESQPQGQPESQPQGQPQSQPSQPNLMKTASKAGHHVGNNNDEVFLKRNKRTIQEGTEDNEDEVFLPKKKKRIIQGETEERIPPIVDSNLQYAKVLRVKTQTYIYVQKNRGYYVEKRQIGKKLYLSCMKSNTEKCPGRGVLLSGANFIDVYKDHDCLQVPNLLTVLRAREECYSLARENPDLTPKQVHSRISRKYPSSIIKYIPFAEIESTLKRRRKDTVPKIPKTFDELKTLLEETQYGKTWDGHQFFRMIQTDEKGTFHNVIFHSDKAKPLLEKNRLIEIDGTFKVVPKILHFYQLLTVLVVYNGIPLPLFFALMTRKTTEAYLAVMAYLKSTFNLSPGSFITDSEIPLVNSLIITFPDTPRSNCYFHYTQGVTLETLKLGLRPLAVEGMGRKIFGCLLAIPLLPADKIWEGVRSMKALIEKFDKGDFEEEKDNEDADEPGNSAEDNETDVGIEVLEERVIQVTEALIAQEEAASSEDGARGTEEEAATSEDGARGTEEEAATSEDGARGTEEEAATSEDGARGTEGEVSNEDGVNNEGEKSKRSGFLKLLNYICNVWIERVGANNLSVHGESHRTTNFLESYHGKFSIHHPNLWRFIDILKDIDKSAKDNFAASELGKKVRKDPERAYVINRLNQKQLETKLALGEIDVMDFLNRGKYQVRTLSNKLLNRYKKKGTVENDNDLIGFPEVEPMEPQKNEGIYRPHPQGTDSAVPQVSKAVTLKEFFHSFNPEESSSHNESESRAEPSATEPSATEPSATEPSASEPSTTQTEKTARVSGNGDESLKLKLLKADFPGLVKAILWVRANKNRLRGDIFEPTCLELPTDKFIKFLKCLREKNSSEWTEEERSEVAFTCEEPSTVTALIRELKTKRKLWPINVVSL